MDSGHRHRGRFHEGPGSVRWDVVQLRPLATRGAVATGTRTPVLSLPLFWCWCFQVDQSSDVPPKPSGLSSEPSGPFKVDQRAHVIKLFMTQRSNWIFFYSIFVLQGFSVIGTVEGPDVDLGPTQVDIYANS